MAAWSWDNTIRVWDLATGGVATQLSGHRDGIIDVAVTGGSVVSSSWDRTLRLWDPARVVKEFATVQTDPVATKVAVSPDGRQLAWGDHDGRVFLGELAIPAVPESASAHRGAVRSLVFSPDGSLLASGGMEGGVRLWRTRPFQPLGELRGHLSPVISLAFTADGRRLATGSEVGELLLFSVDRPPTRTFGTAPSGDLNLLVGGVHGSIALVARRLVERSDAFVRAWDPGTGKACWDIPVRLPPSVKPSDASTVFAFSPRAGAVDRAMASGQAGDPIGALPSAIYGEVASDGSRLAVMVGGEVQVWQLPAGEDCMIAPYRGPRSVAAFRPDGGAILIAGPDGIVQVLSLQDQRWALNRDAGGAVLGGAWSPDGERAALLLPFDRRVVVLDVEQDSPPLEISYTEGPVPANLDFSGQPTPAFSADGLRLAAPVPGGSVAVWDASTGARLVTLQGHGFQPTSVAFSPDGTRLLTGATDGRVRIWDASSGDLLLQLEDSGSYPIEPTKVTFGAVLASVDPPSQLGPGALLRLAPRTFGTDTGGTAAVVTVGFSRDGSSVGATYSNGEVRVWNAIQDLGRSR